jgi:hypothetical protein
MNDLFSTAIFVALTYLLLNPAKVASRTNLMIAWIVFLGAIVFGFFGAIGNPGDAWPRWARHIQELIAAASIFFMLLSVDPGIAAGMTGGGAGGQPPQQPPQA